jgi:hypothetical protein
MDFIITSKIISVLAILQQLLVTLGPLGDRALKTTLVLRQTLFVASSFSESDLLFLIASVCFILCLSDPMVEETVLGATISAPGRSCEKEIAGMVEQPTNPPSTAMSPCLSNPLPPVDDIQTPGMFRSEDEQLVGHELIEALRKIKLPNVPHLSPSSRIESSLSFEATVVSLKRNQVSLIKRKLNSSLEIKVLKWSEIY